MSKIFRVHPADLIVQGNLWPCCSDLPCVSAPRHFITYWHRTAMMLPRIMVFLSLLLLMTFLPQACASLAPSFRSSVPESSFDFAHQQSLPMSVPTLATYRTSTQPIPLPLSWSTVGTSFLLMTLLQLSCFRAAYVVAQFPRFCLILFLLECCGLVIVIFTHFNRWKR